MADAIISKYPNVLPNTGINCKYSLITSYPKHAKQNLRKTNVICKSIYFGNSHAAPIGRKKEPSVFGVIPNINVLAAVK